jgi:hypothetical protein
VTRTREAGDRNLTVLTLYLREKRLDAYDERVTEGAPPLGHEPCRVCRRLRTLRRWSHHEHDDEQILS